MQLSVLIQVCGRKKSLSGIPSGQLWLRCLGCLCVVALPQWLKDSVFFPLSRARFALGCRSDNWRSLGLVVSTAMVLLFPHTLPDIRPSLHGSAAMEGGRRGRRRGGEGGGQKEEGGGRREEEGGGEGQRRISHQLSVFLTQEDTSLGMRLVCMHLPLLLCVVVSLPDHTSFPCL